MLGNMNTLGLLPYTGSFAKLGIGYEPMPGLGKPPFCIPQCLRVSVVSNLILRWVVALVLARKKIRINHGDTEARRRRVCLNLNRSAWRSA